eukprot:SAG31_NODE_41853_length_274_cov_0.594286_1_plen_56_part_10
MARSSTRESTVTTRPSVFRDLERSQEHLDFDGYKRRFSATQCNQNETVAAAMRRDQ